MLTDDIGQLEEQTLKDLKHMVERARSLMFPLGASIIKSVTANFLL